MRTRSATLHLRMSIRVSHTGHGTPSMASASQATQVCPHCGHRTVNKCPVFRCILGCSRNHVSKDTISFAASRGLSVPPMSRYDMARFLCVSSSYGIIPTWLSGLLILSQIGLARTYTSYDSTAYCFGMAYLYYVPKSNFHVVWWRAPCL